MFENIFYSNHPHARVKKQHAMESC